MKKLIVLMLVLGLANVASAVITYTPTVGGSNADVLANVGDLIAVDISASGAADYLLGTGELLVTISGPAQFNADALDNLTYDPTNTFWDPGVGLIVNSAIDNATNVRVSAASVSTMSLFWMAMPGDPIGNIIVEYLGGGIATVTIAPNNAPNAWGNTAYVIDGQAMDDLQAAGLSINIVPEPATIALLGLGGLALLRRRRK